MKNFLKRLSHSIMIVEMFKPKECENNLYLKKQPNERSFLQKW